MTKKFTTFIDHHISIEVRRRPQLLPALNLLSSLYAAYLCPLEESSSMNLPTYAIDRYRYQDRHEWQTMATAFKLANRVEYHLFYGRNEYMVQFTVEFFTAEMSKKAFMQISGWVSLSSGEFINVIHSAWMDWVWAQVESTFQKKTFWD